MPHRFVLTSRWRLDTTPAAVWQLLTDIEAWPAWWRFVKRAHRIERGPSSPLGDVAERAQRLEGHAEGDLRGVGTWLLDAADAGGVDVTYRWEVLLERRWMRALSFVLRPLFEWNHFKVMRAGAAGMAQRLGCRLSQTSEWTGSRWP